MGIIAALLFALCAIVIVPALGAVIMRLTQNIESARQQNRELTQQCEALLFLTQVLQAQVNHLQKQLPVAEQLNRSLRSGRAAN